MPKDSAGLSELRRGWPLILAAAVGVGTGRSPLLIFSVGVFTKPIAAEYHWGRGEIQTMILFGTIGALIGSPLVGWLMDRRGVRPVILVSTILFAVSFAMIGLGTTSVFTFYAITFICSIVGAGTLPVTWSRAILAAFTVRRGLALGLALTGTGFAASFAPPYANWLAQHFSWRIGYAGLALLPLILSFPLSFWILKPSPTTAAAARARAGDPGLTLREAVRSYRFWIIGASFFCASAGTGGIVAHLVPMLTDRGFDAVTAAKVAGAQGLALIFGRAAVGYLLDKIWAPAIASFALVLPVASCLILAAGVSNVAVATGAVILVGFAAGAEFDLVAFLTARYFGMKHFGSLYGVLYAIFVSASGIAPGAFGRVFDATGSYGVALRLGAVSLLIGAALVLTLGRYPSEYAAPVPAE